MALPQPNITLSMSEFNRLLARREAAQMLAMASRWHQQEMALESAMRRLADAIELRRQNGLPIGPGALTHLESYRDLLNQVQAQSRSYEDFAKANIMAEQMAYGQLGIDAANAQIARSGVGIAFNRLNVSAVQNMVGLTADGSPLFDVLKKRALSPDMIGGLTDKLIEAVSLGYNPRKTAEMMADGLAQGLTKALTIARTEQLRVFRTASQSQYQETDFIQEYQRHAAFSERTCLACIALDGKIYPIDELMELHVSDRCFMTPVIPGFTTPSRSVGDWFERQPESVQREIMGNGHYELWKAGTPMQDMIKITDDPTWGPTIGIVPLRNLQK